METDIIAEGGLLTLGDACKILNIHGNTLRRWGARGVITEYRLGPAAHRRYRAEDVAKLLIETTKG